ncbi:MAG TPA: competence/damage-inducible protein A [Acidimicrobiaceae bacterium]|jgi:nicotinamide-nucleotide amidase|nr:competence/damage-inducible protein A [Acidimicrobiaceae bacterium]
MRVEVIAVGTELLLGQIIDTNSSWIGEQLALAGLDTHLQVKVGDNVERIVSAIRDALGRSDAVICCGGLGPTQDDLTRQAIALVLDQELVFDEDKADLIRHMFGSRGRDMPDNNLLQAFRPAGSRFIEQQPGTAPGLVCPVSSSGEASGGEKVIYAVPGVPWEMKEMILGTVIPDLRDRSGETAVIRSRTLKTWGQSESGIAELLSDRILELDELGNPTLAFLASGIEGLKVRMTAKASTDDEADVLLADEEARVRRILGDIVFGADDDSMESVVLAALGAADLTLAVAESLTGGLVASRLVDVAGASKVFRGGVVTYASDTKFSLLGVPEGPVVTCEAAEAMATGVRKLLGADVGLGLTGVAGPESSEGRPPGTVCLAVDLAGDISAIELRLPGRRQQVREFSCITVLNLLRSKLEAQGPTSQ